MVLARLLVLVLAPVVLLASSAAASGTSGIVVSQVFGGGGNAGAPYANDYVELFNRGSTAVDVSGWTVQYATAAGSSWQTTPLAGTIQPGRYYLVGLAGGATGAALPAPDATDTTNLSATSGKIALVRDAQALACGATAGSCSANPLVEDLVGFGAAADFEGAAAAPGGSSTAAVIRNDAGCTDTDANGADFAAGAPSPRNSTAAANACSTPPPSGLTASQDASVDIDVQPVLSVSLERPTLSFGRTVAGGAPAAISERVTVLSNHPAGYALTVHRSAFAPRDLPLAIQAGSPPPGGTLGSGVAGGGFAPVPIAPTVLTLGTTASTSATEGDVWPTNVGFTTPFPSVAPGRYTATLTFTVIGR
jgi:Lamin Tail Domain